MKTLGFPRKFNSIAELAIGIYLFSEIAIILILPDREESITAMGYTLCPRFLTYVDSNSSELTAVLGKMFEKYSKEVMEEWYNIWKS